MRWVKLTLPPRARRRWLLITTRLSASSLAGTARTLVAVGTVQRGLHVRDDPRGRAAQRCRRRAAAPPLRPASAAAWPASSPACAAGSAVSALRRAGCRSALVSAWASAGAAAGCRGRRRWRVRRSGWAPAASAAAVAVRRAGSSPAAVASAGCRRPAPGPVPAGPVVGEEVVPGRVDAVRVGQVALVHVLDEPLVGAEVARRRGRVRCSSAARSSPLVSGRPRVAVVGPSHSRDYAPGLVRSPGPMWASATPVR